MQYSRLILQGYLSVNQESPLRQNDSRTRCSEKNNKNNLKSLKNTEKNQAYKASSI